MRGPVHAADKFGSTPLHEASHWSTHAEALAALLAHAEGLTCYVPLRDPRAVDKTNWPGTPLTRLVSCCT